MGFFSMDMLEVIDLLKEFADSCPRLQGNDFLLDPQSFLTLTLKGIRFILRENLTMTHANA